MKFHRSLRYRGAFAFALFGGLVSLLLAAGLFFAVHDDGERLIEQTLREELDDYMARRARDPGALPPTTFTVLGFVAPLNESESDLPSKLHGLQPGSHETNLNRIPYRVAVVDRDGERYLMLYNLTQQQRRETRFLTILATGVLVMSLLSSAVGFWLAGRVIAPVTGLVRRVRGMNPEHGQTPLADDFPQDEVGELASAFDQLIDRMRGFIDREWEFASDVSHELRTPLAVAQGATEVLLEDPGLAERQRERLVRVERAVRNMSDLTSALLLLAREKGAFLPKRPAAVDEVLSDVVEKHRYLLKGKSTRVEVELNASPRLMVEPTLLVIVFANLIRNAFSYTDQGEVRIRLDADRVVVEDTGAGIRAEELGRVFQRYYKGSTSRGAGIGLSLVKRVCDRHGWEISIESREGQGTTARFVFGQQSREGANA